MVHGIEDNKLILEYMLGSLAEEEKEAFEDRYFADDPLFEELVIAEEELIDSYLQGELSTQQQEQFEKSYLASPAHRDRVEIARILLKRATSTEVLTDSNTAHDKSPSWWQSLLAFWHSQSFALRFSVSIAALLIALGASWLIIKSAQQSSSVGSQHMISFELISINVRASNDLQVLNLPQEAKMVEIKLRFDRGSYKMYRAELQTARGVVIWQESGLEAQTVNLNKMVVVTLPAELLSAGTYLITLSGDMDKDYSDLLAEYHFKVVRT
jgi:hypothetical protein